MERTAQGVSPSWAEVTLRTAATAIMIELRMLTNGCGAGSDRSGVRDCRRGMRLGSRRSIEDVEMRLDSIWTPRNG